MENFHKRRFLIAWQDEKLYIRAAQAHSGGVGALIDMSQALGGDHARPREMVQRWLARGQSGGGA
eukprot:2992684-Alexandrium_andersonii.AAC.1